MLPALSVEMNEGDNGRKATPLLLASGGWADAPHSVAWLIFGFTLLRLLLAASVPLVPQEAYYWSWSRYPDWSYFDHPPLATYAIALTTSVFGSTVFGVKAAAVLWSLGWNLLWARLVLDMYGDRRLVFWSLAALNLTALYEAFGIGPTPDGPLIFAWVGTVWAVGKVSQTGDGRWWFAAGAFIGLSWLGKYTGVLLLPVILLYLLSSPAHRHWLLKPQPWLALLLACVVFTPVLIWNAQHEWVSLAFQSTRRAGGMGGFKPRYLLVLLATQFLLLTPYLFVVAMGALWRGLRGWFAEAMDDRTRLLLLSAAVPIALFAAVSLRSLVKANWLAPAWFTLVILGVHQGLARADGLRRLQRGLVSSGVLLLAAGAVLLIPDLPLRYGMNSWSGWKEAAARVEKARAAERAAGRDSFVFSPSYKASAMIWFYLPGQPRTYAQDIVGEPALQFDHFPLERSLAGATGILVLSDEDDAKIDRERLKNFFDACDRIDAVDAGAPGRVARRVEILRCPNYKGHPRAARQNAATSPG
jgi:4-amino-4-deoxy-L-arabinose transferase-like glycosyltransferase